MRQTPLHGCKVQDAGTVEVLLKNGADISAKDGFHRQALHLGAARGDTRVVDILIKYGADINAKDQSGNGPLHLACFCRRASMAALLISCGADPFLESFSGAPISSITELAKGGEKGFKAVLQAVKDKDPDKYMDWWMAQEK